ncbi:glycosyltransferase family 4 protein [Gloeocapsopsis sp. IPPAS B-1203]|uniref:glycosyltransferase family 4 protein n=1 Tax=Gloeocapsopsis sp. IPPAS B-1203 TaxID=2049454 RepID=UPI000C1838F6|nr:glycosyltransferase family 4 protein [Gloeocapsopsis sp. IPPAS B-1203]PIG90644.1 group 1 glycosyl transferase [Gloeocapsopsis sp. IPPAS B-1203]
MRKLLVIPGWCKSLGGNTVSLLAMVKGFQRSESQQVCVLTQAGSLVEEYLQQQGLESCLKTIVAQDQRQFVQRALQWVNQQPRDYPLLLENCATSKTLPAIALHTVSLRLSRRPVYYMFRDLAISYNPVGNLSRTVVFTCLAPRILCNSKFTAENVRGRLGEIQGILHPPIDLDLFNTRPPVGSPPQKLQPILALGARIILTPSRISKDPINDKNLRSLPIVLAELKAAGHHYHGVVIGQDTSSEQTRSRALLAQAEDLGVADRFTILPPALDIENYYKYADVVVTLAPREPFGRTVVEAIACGVPVVGSNTGGIGEILHNFAPHWTVDPHNPGAAAQTIVHVVHAPDTPTVLAQGQQWVEANCSLVPYAQKIMEITGLQSPHLQEILAY